MASPNIPSASFASSLLPIVQAFLALQHFALLIIRTSKVSHHPFLASHKYYSTAIAIHFPPLFSIPFPLSVLSADPPQILHPQLLPVVLLH